MFDHSNLTVIPLNCGRLEMKRGLFSGDPFAPVLELPVLAFLIIHPRAQILFDTGLPEELWSGSGGMDLAPGLTAGRGNSAGLEEEIKGRGYSLRDTDMIINSHPHIDHAGGNSLCPSARLYTAEKKDRGADLDVLGDGSLILLATPGHTQDHRSLLVRSPKRQALLTGDACFRPANLSDLKPPLILEDRAEAGRSLQRMGEISRERETVVLTSHDPAAPEGNTFVL